MIDVLRQSEGTPASYPAMDGDDEQREDALWRRIEAYIAHRWGARDVTWILVGAGDWTPPLTPATIENVEVWNEGAWHSIDAVPGPLGYQFKPGNYRVTATVGSDDPPPDDVLEAHTRLSGYLADALSSSDAASSQTVTYGNDLAVSLDRPAVWIASAMQHSGAADLLRRYRRA